MKKEGTKRHDFLRMLAILIIIMIFKTFFINSLMVTIVNAVADPGINGSVVNTFVGYIISAAICGVALGIIAFRRIEGDGEEKREFLEFTADKEPTAETLRDFMKTRKNIKRNLIATAAALAVMLIYTYGVLAAQYPIYTLLFLLDFSIMFGLSTWAEFRRQTPHPPQMGRRETAQVKRQALKPRNVFFVPACANQIKSAMRS